MIFVTRIRLLMQLFYYYKCPITWFTALLLCSCLRAAKSIYWLKTIYLHSSSAWFFNDEKNWVNQLTFRDTGKSFNACFFLLSIQAICFFADKMSQLCAISTLFLVTVELTRVNMSCTFSYKDTNSLLNTKKKSLINHCIFIYFLTFLFIEFDIIAFQRTKQRQRQLGKSSKKNVLKTKPANNINL